MCSAFSEVVDIASDDENSYKMVLDWIEKAMNDMPKQICYGSVEKLLLVEQVIVATSKFTVKVWKELLLAK